MVNDSATLHRLKIIAKVEFGLIRVRVIEYVEYEYFSRLHSFSKTNLEK